MSSAGGCLSALRACSRALMRFLATAELCRKRWLSLPVSIMWQWFSYSWPAALRVALPADAASITIMEVVDNAIMLAIPGAMDAPVLSLHFWASMAVALAVAGVAAFPVNRWLIARGKGHAVVHAHH